MLARTGLAGVGNSYKKNLDQFGLWSEYTVL